MKKLIDRFGVTPVLVGLFLLLSLFMLARCEAGWYMEEQHDSTAGISSSNPGLDRVCAGYVFAGGSGFYACPLVAVSGDINKGSAEIGFSELIAPRWRAEIRLTHFDDKMHGGGSVRRIIGDGPFQTSIGVSYWLDESPGSNSDVTYNLGLRWNF